MIQYEPRFRAFAMCLSALAGFIDSIGFLLTGGLFVSFMSGNSTRLAVGLASGSSVAALAAGLITLFVAGVIAGALLAPVKPLRRKCVVLAASSAALFGSACLVTSGSTVTTAMLLAFGMGLLNNVFQRNGEVSIGVTYMTGTLVRAGQRIAAALRREEPSDWLPYLFLWASLVGGAVAGALVAIPHLTLSLWIATAANSVMAVFAHRLEVTRAR